ncbi:MAG: hypothetical protein NTV82_04750 [Candidatus Aminicenantes bacterium]|jgi:hypothetical protein|nr:hypothetical protein [Candidatus Aminicenantes bacterium]
MKARGLLIVLILAVAIVYLIWFSKSGEKTHLERQVDRFVQAKEDLTRVNMQSLQKIILSYIAGEGQAPKSLQDLRNSSLLVGGTMDGWGKSIKYERLSDSSFRLISAGKDKTFDTEDDIVLDY